MTEVDVLHGLVVSLGLLDGLGGNADGSVVEVAELVAHDVEERHEGGRVGIADVGEFVEQAVLLGSLNSGGVQVGAVDGALLGVVIGLQVIGAVVEHPGQGLDADVGSVPVVGVGFEHDGVLLGEVGDQIRAAVGQMVRILTIEIGVVVDEVRAELAALGLIVGAAQREERVVAQQRGEPDAGLLEGVLEGVVIHGLDADFGEIGDLAVDVSLGVDDLDAVIAGQAFQTALHVHQVLHAGDEVVSGHVSDLAALRVGPLGALADVEGEDGVVLVGLKAGGQRGLLDILHVVLEQAVNGVDNGLGVGGTIGGQTVPGLGIGVVGDGVGVLQLVAVVGHVLLDPGFERAGAGELGPLRLDRVAVGGLDELGGDDRIVEAIAVIAPERAVDGSGHSAADGVLTASGGEGQHDRGVEKLRFGNGLERIALRDVVGLQSFLIVLVVSAEDVVVDLLGIGIIVGSVIGPVFSSKIAAAAGAALAIAAGCEAEHHDKCQNNCHEPLDGCLHVFQFPPFLFY